MIGAIFTLLFPGATFVVCDGAPVTPAQLEAALAAWDYPPELATVHPTVETCPVEAPDGYVLVKLYDAEAAATSGQPEDVLAYTALAVGRVSQGAAIAVNGHIWLPTDDQRVLAHEVGHAIGFTLHSPDPSNLMYFANSSSPYWMERWTPAHLARWKALASS